MKEKWMKVISMGVVITGLTACGFSGIHKSTQNLMNSIGDNAKTIEQDTTEQSIEEKSSNEVSSDTEVSSLENTKSITGEDVEIASDFELRYLNLSMKMIKNSYQAGENSMISPASILSALTMVENGAAGETKQQMELVLGEGVSSEQQSEELTAFLAQLTNTEKCHLSQANSIWLKDTDQSFTVRDDFLQKNADIFGADVYSAAFDQNTLKDINSWVKEKTDGMIPKMLNEIKQDTLMYLINAVAFEAEWQETYLDAAVSEKDFYLADGTKKQVPMMHSGETGFLENESVTGFVKPYTEGYSFLALLPKENTSLSEVLSQMDGEAIQKLFETERKKVKVNAVLPKFEMEYEDELSQQFIAFGMPLAFDMENADFSGIGQYENGNLAISGILHKTYIVVDELGTKAGAATAVMKSGAATSVEKEEIRDVILNRPFFYAVIDNETHLPVFLGVVENPQ